MAAAQAPSATPGDATGGTRARPEVGSAVSVLTEIDMAKMKGYTGDACPDCGSFTMVRNGACLKCVTCGATSGCS